LDPRLVLAANAAATGGLRPDLTLVIDLDPELGRARQVKAGKRLDRLDQESAAFHREVAAYYLAARADDVQHLVQHLDGTVSPNQLLDAAWVALSSARPAIFGTGER
jgi:dTMP kinase